MRQILIILFLGALLFNFLLNIDSSLTLSLQLQIISIVLVGALIIYTSLVWSTSYLITRSAEHLTPQQVVASMMWSSGFLAGLVGMIATFAIEWIYDLDLHFIDYVYNIGLFSVIVAGITAVNSLRSFIHRWKALLLMEEGLKQAVLKAEFESLKNQVNPHFLFNSLNILSALIPDDATKSVQFVERLSKVFRYSLQHSDQNTVDLATELKVAESYLFINQMRFGESFTYEIDLKTAEKSKQIITQGLLTLLENVVKHNECSVEKPLNVRIYTDHTCLVVANTFQPKNRLGIDSTGIGLRNLQNRYSQFANQSVDIQTIDGEFIVKLPLL